ncbi:MAG TPA: glycoside hydrolase family 97 protein [Bryobacteraceae bacterium]|nr:glycoside hydrolase family 97 protein [Bryobacteraceae bacterium]
MRHYILLFAACLASVTAQPITLKSPDGNLAIRFEKTPKRLVYDVSFRGKPLIVDSALALELQGQPELGPDLSIVNASTSSADETYHLLTGKASTVRNRFNAVRLQLEEHGAWWRKLELEARAYDDAVAFRYVIPDQTAMRELRLTAEDTEFRLAKDATAHALILPNYRTMYESEFLRLPVSALANQGGGVNSRILIGLPLLLEVPGVAWMAITEADLRDYSSMYVMNTGDGWNSYLLESKLAPSMRDPDICVQGALPHHSAWRVLLVGDEPGRLIESNVITSLNPESAIADTSWIHAGKASWDWWSGSIGRDGKPAYTTETMKYYVDFAAQSGFPYMLVDAGWSAPGDITKMNGKVDIPELVRYAAGKNVRVWIWAHWSEVDRQLEEAFPLYEKWGVAGVKIDFMSRDDQSMIAFYYRVAETAARHHLIVDFHGATKPWGMERTYPNVMGFEAVAGMEQAKGGMRANPDHDVTLPFTRMLAGRMDYTPGGFDNVTKGEFEARSVNPMVMGTRAHQLAMYVIYDAPFQMVSDSPHAYNDQPAFQFIHDVPATWDETRVLEGRPGEFIAMARRSGGDWYVGAMSNWNPRRLDLPLTFLGPGRYRAEIYADADDADKLPKNVSIRKQVVDRSSRLQITLAPGGGYAVRFVPLSQ